LSDRSVQTKLQEQRPLTVSLRLNYIFNFIGGAWTAVLGILFVPIYLRYIGVEAYGIIGFFTSLQALFFLLDLGLSPAFNREVAQHTAGNLTADSPKLRDMTRTLATVNVMIAVVIGVFLCLLAPIFANYWVNASILSASDVSQSFLIMAVGSALQFPIAFYLSGLAGMQRQVASNIVQIVFGTLRSVGAVAVLAFYSPTLQAFLLWQALITFLQMLVMARVFYSGLPKASEKPRFDREILKKIWRFAAGNTAISLTALLLTQTDKIVLSRLLPLEAFGYYSLAGMISVTALVMLTNSVSKVAYPEFSALIAKGDEEGLRRAYHKNAQFVTVLVAPAAIVLAVFSQEILLVWTRNPLIAEEAYVLLTLLAVATGINCVAWIPYYAQLAHGWTRLTFFFNVFAVVVLLLLLLYMVPRYGAVGGAVSFLLVQFGYLTLYAALMFRRILTGEMFNWLVRDLLVPSAVVVIIVLAAAFFVSGVERTVPILASLSITTVAAYCGAAIAADLVRERIVSSIKNTLGWPKYST
jgi:O-antigen/teichoic acid export membrane protein